METTRTAAASAKTDARSAEHDYRQVINTRVKTLAPLAGEFIVLRRELTQSPLVVLFAQRRRRM